MTREEALRLYWRAGSGLIGLKFRRIVKEFVKLR